MNNCAVSSDEIEEYYVDCVAPTYEQVHQPAIPLTVMSSNEYTTMNRESSSKQHQLQSFEELQQTDFVENNVESYDAKDVNAKRSVCCTNTILVCFVLIVQVAMLIILVFLLAQTFARDTTTSAGTSNSPTAASSTGSINLTQWANDIVSKVNSNVTGSLPDFNEWANGVSQNTFQLFYENNTNFTGLDKQILQTTRDSAQKLINIVNTLSNLQDTSTSTAGVADDTLLITKQLLSVFNNSIVFLPKSCKQILSQVPNSPSGYYILTSINGSTTYTTYCNMGTLCGSGGGWTRLAYLDMTDATQNCPSEFNTYRYLSRGVRACGRNRYVAGCASVQFPSNGISYSQICGRVTDINMVTLMQFIQQHMFLEITSILIMLMVLVSLVGLLVNMSGH